MCRGVEAPTPQDVVLTKEALEVISNALVRGLTVEVYRKRDGTVLIKTVSRRKVNIRPTP